jgi:hypothetical protein
MFASHPDDSHRLRLEQVLAELPPEPPGGVGGVGGGGRWPGSLRDPTLARALGA